MSNRKAHRRYPNWRRSEDFVQHRDCRPNRSAAFEKAVARADRRAARRDLTTPHTQDTTEL